MKPSSLNPYAESYIPLSKRDANDSTYVTARVSQIDNECVQFGGPMQLHYKASIDSKSHGTEKVPSPEIFTLKSQPVHGYGPSAQNVNQVLDKQISDEEYDMDSEYLQMSFPGISVQSLTDVYLANKGDLEATIDMLNQLEVLSDPQKRAIYDQYGEEGLKDIPPSGSGGFPFGNGCGESGFNPRNAEDIFAEFFGSSPFGFGSSGPGRSMRFPSEGSGIFGGFSGSDNIFRTNSESSMPKKPPPVESKLPCSLAELYSGSTRKMKISRTVVDANGRQVPETEILTIDVKPGWKKGTKITFPDKGNEQHNQLPADLVFVIDEKPHDVYKRDGNDIIVNQRVSLAEALGGTAVNLVTLDGRNLSIPVTDIVSPSYELVVAREGMPIVREPGNRGDLRIKFEVKFPTRLTPEQRVALKRALGG